jgi:hypothetical protein
MSMAQGSRRGTPIVEWTQKNGSMDASCSQRRNSSAVGAPLKPLTSGLTYGMPERPRPSTAGTVCRGIAQELCTSSVQVQA